MFYEFWYVRLGTEAFDQQTLTLRCPLALEEMYRLAIDAPQICSDSGIAARAAFEDTSLNCFSGVQIPSPNELQGITDIEACHIGIEGLHHGVRLENGKYPTLSLLLSRPDSQL